MFQFMIYDGHAVEAVGRPTVFMTADDITKLLNDEKLLAAVEKELKPDTIIGCLGEDVGGIYEDNPIEVESLENIIKAHGELGFYDYI